MIVRIRQCCCALTTFVRLVAVFFLVFHLLLALSAAIWFTLFSTFTASSNTSAEPGVGAGGDKDLLVLPPSGGEVDDRTFDTFLITGSNRDQQSRQKENQMGRKLDLLIVIVLGIFATVGILVNVLLMLAIKLEKRTLFFPWFVFHLITVMGCFAGGIYLALWFTILQQPDKTKPEDQVLAVLAVFPIVGGIFLIFLWILVDQLYIQMGVKKNDTGGPPGSSALKRKNSNAVMVIDHSTYANSYATLPRPGKILGVGELERRQQYAVSGSTPTRRKAVHRTKSMTSQYTLPRRLGNNDATSHHHLHHGGGGGGSRPRIDAFDAHHHNHHQPHHQPQRHQRARSLEHILDGGDHHRGHGTSGGNTHGGPNYWVASGATLAVSRPKKTGRSGGEGSRHTSRAPSVENMMDESSLDTNSTSIPSYCTMDRRSRGANPQAPNSVGTSRHQPSHYRPKSRPIPISSDESSDIGVRPLSVPPNRRIYKVNSFQRPQGTMSMATSSSVELLLDDEPRLQPQTHHGGLGASSHSRLASAEADSERSNGVMIQYDDDLVAAHHAASKATGGAPGDVGSTGVTRFDLADNDDSFQSSMVDLDLNLLPLDAKILPQEAIRNQGHYHHLPRRAGPRHRSGYNTDTIRSNHSAKSVTIANQVTEFHYSEDDQAVPKSGTINRRTKGTDWVPEPVYPLPPPPPPPPEREPYDDDDAHRVNASPTPPPPPLPTPPTVPAQTETGKSWLSRLSPLKSRKDIMTSDANENNSGFVDLYYSVSDVRL